MDERLTIEDEIVAALRRIIRAVDLHSRKLALKIGLTWPQLATLRTAARIEGATIKQLAQAVHLGQATLTGVIQRLERAGLVERRPHLTDRRSVMIFVTDCGQQVLNDAPSLLQDRFREQLGLLKDWERTQTLASLQRIAEMMDAETIEASPLLVTGPVEATVAEADVSAASEPTGQSEDAVGTVQQSDSAVSGKAS